MLIYLFSFVITLIFVESNIIEKIEFSKKNNLEFIKINETDSCYLNYVKYIQPIQNTKNQNVSFIDYVEYWNDLEIDLVKLINNVCDLISEKIKRI